MAKPTTKDKREFKQATDKKAKKDKVKTKFKELSTSDVTDLEATGASVAQIQIIDLLMAIEKKL